MAKQAEATKEKEKPQTEQVNEKVLDDRQIAVASALDSIKERFGEGAIMRLGEVKKKDIESISTGSISLDLALGIGGVPRGRIIEIYGPESSGKSTLALHVAASCQNAGGTVAYVDAEHALDPQYAKRLGVNLNDLLISQPDTGEQALDIVETLVKSAAVDLIVVDSVAALTPRAEIEGEMGDSHMGLQARLMSQALRKLTGISHKTNTTIIFINQIRMKIGVMFGNPEETTGGKALKFYSSVRIDLRRRAQIKMGEKIIGNRVHAKVVKNKVAPPFRVAEFDIMYNEGISYEGDVVDKGIEYKILQKAGSWISYGDRKLGQGREATKQILRDEPKLAKELEKAIWKAVESEEAAQV
ncbi:MAG: recombinase RecA [Candidatus Andersenbacteria bacterium]